MKVVWLILFAATFLLTGCFNRPGGVETVEEVLPTDLAAREVLKVENSFLLGTLSPLAVDRAYRESVRLIRTGQLSYAEAPFFSGMTDEALIRQAVLSWDLAPLFEQLPAKTQIRVRSFPNRKPNALFEEGLTRLLAANTEKTEVVREGGGYILFYEPVTEAVYRSWSMKGKLPYLQRYVSAGAFLELIDGGGRVIFSSPIESSANYIGSFEPLCFLPAMRGEETAELTLPMEQRRAVRESGLDGFVFGPENRILVSEAFRNINLAGGRIASAPGIREKGVIVLIGDQEEPPDYYKWGGEIRSMLTANGLPVLLTARGNKDSMILRCRVDYAGVSALPGKAGKFLRQGVVVFWAELSDAGGRIHWAGQLVGRSKAREDFTLFMPLLFPQAEIEKEAPKSVVKSI